MQITELFAYLPKKERKSKHNLLVFDEDKKYFYFRKKLTMLREHLNKNHKDPILGVSSTDSISSS